MRMAINAVLAAVLGLLAGCGGPGRATKAQTITIKGSDTMVILGQRWAEIYMHHNPGVTVQVTGGGSGTGIAALINGATDICAASRPMKDKEKGQVRARHGREPVETAVALDGVAVFLNEANVVEGLTVAQLEAIYRGKTTDWKDVGGASAMDARTAPAPTCTSWSTS